MKEMIAYCGLNCTECPAFIATQENDDKKRKEVAEMWKGELNTELKAEDINCDGCLSNSGRLFLHCSQCNVRKCASEKSLDNCAHCEVDGCEKLQRLHKGIPEAKEGFERIKKELNK